MIAARSAARICDSASYLLGHHGDRGTTLRGPIMRASRTARAAGRPRGGARRGRSWPVRLAADGRRAPTAADRKGRRRRQQAPASRERRRPPATVTSPAADATNVPALDRRSPSRRDRTRGDHGRAEGRRRARRSRARCDKDGKTWLPGQGAGLRHRATRRPSPPPATTARPAPPPATFTTMAKPQAGRGDAASSATTPVVGVGMPLIVKFGRAIPEDYRDDVQRRMTVTSTPAQEGIWHWFSATEVHYRPKVYWKANTKISVPACRPAACRWATAGTAAPTSRSTCKIGPALVMTVDNKTKQMTVQQDGKVIKTIPVSLGKPSTPVVQRHDGRHREAAEDGLRHDARSWARTRATAPRSTTRSGSPGAASSSTPRPGRRATRASATSRTAASTCRMANAAWLFGDTLIGDPITVKGTEAQAAERQRLDRLEHELGRVRQGQRPPVRASGRPGRHDHARRRGHPDPHADRLTRPTEPSRARRERLTSSPQAPAGPLRDGACAHYWGDLTGLEPATPGTTTRCSTS